MTYKLLVSLLLALLWTGGNDLYAQRAKQKRQGLSRDSLMALDIKQDTLTTDSIGRIKRSSFRCAVLFIRKYIRISTTAQTGLISSIFK